MAVARQEKLPGLVRSRRPRRQLPRPAGFGGLKDRGSEGRDAHGCQCVRRLIGPWRTRLNVDLRQHSTAGKLASRRELPRYCPEELATVKSPTICTAITFTNVIDGKIMA